MDLAGFDEDDTTFMVTHSLLVDRLQYLPNNTVEGEQVLLVRAITNDKSSTNLAVDINIVGAEKIDSESEISSNSSIIIGILSILVLILFTGLTIVTMKFKQTGLWDEDEYSREYVFPENNLDENYDILEQDESSD